MFKQTITVVLAGSTGRHLPPLTAERAKAAVPFGGKYRVIDFALTNCLHSGIRRILVLTQYKSHSLQKHIRDGWSVFNPEMGEYITTVPPQMRTGKGWYAGTADALYQNRYLLERSGAEHVMVLSGDHIYRMDYAPMMAFHKQHGGDVTIAGMAHAPADAATYGVISIDEQQRITALSDAHASDTATASTSNQLTSMGIYIFSIEKLLQLLKATHHGDQSAHSFVHDILPTFIDSGEAFGYRFGGPTGRVTPDRYWRDIDTIDAYYQANMDLLDKTPPMNLYQEDWPVRTYSGQHPPARTVPGEYGDEGIAINSIISNGAVIAGGSSQHSILFNNVFVDDESMIQDSLLFDGVRVGKRVQLRNCIIDKEVEIPDGMEIGFDRAEDEKRFEVSPNGIVVIPKYFTF